jgi:phosphopantetheine--protein transferase-like protein
MSIQCGVDLILNSRLKNNLEKDKFLEKVFHASELVNKNKLIGIFALKEATMKALGEKLDWKDIEVNYNNQGKPQIILSNDVKPKGISCIEASVSHDGEYTIGIVVVES